jgi:hypothetical protein
MLIFIVERGSLAKYYVEINVPDYIHVSEGY